MLYSQCLKLNTHKSQYSMQHCLALAWLQLKVLKQRGATSQRARMEGRGEEDTSCGSEGDGDSTSKPMLVGGCGLALRSEPMKENEKMGRLATCIRHQLHPNPEP